MEVNTYIPINLKKYLEDKGHVVTNDLKDKDIDVILITFTKKNI